MIAKLRASEPVRLFVYPALLALVVYLVGRGLVDAELADIITGVAALALGIPAAELARRRVTSPAGLGAAVAAGTEAVIDQVEQEAVQVLGSAAATVLQQVRQRVAELGAAGVSSGRHRLPEQDG